MALARNSALASGGTFASQKHLDHLRLLHGGCELALKDLLAGVEHDHAIGDLLDETHQMLDLARALATRPRLLLLDELAAGLNPAELDWIAGQIKALATTGTAIIVVEHLMGFIEQITDRVIVLNAGKEIFEGKLAAAVRQPQVIEVFLGGEHAA